MNIDDFFDSEEELRMLDDEYRFRAFLREYGLSSREARQAFKKDVDEL